MQRTVNERRSNSLHLKLFSCLKLLTFSLYSVRLHSNVSTLDFFLPGLSGNFSRATTPLFFLKTGCPFEVLIVLGNRAIGQPLISSTAVTGVAGAANLAEALEDRTQDCQS